MPIDFPTASSECNTYGYTYDSNCTGSDGVTLDYDQTWHAVVLNGVTAWIPLSGESSTGVDGVDGAQGPQGATGQSGTIGFQGHTGAKGEKGDNGTEGSPGNDGAPGADGVDAVAAGISFEDINVLETMFVKTIPGGQDEFILSSTDAFTYDPSNLGALRINRLREDITPATLDTNGNLNLRGVCGPCFHVQSNSNGSNENILTKIFLDDTDISGSPAFKYWMPGDFVTLIVNQTNTGTKSNSNQFGHEGDRKFRSTNTTSVFTGSEIRYGNGINECLSFGDNQHDIDVLYINCINDVGGAIKPYFIVNHLQFHDGLTS
tara:strand:+ start:6363 stop:7319 length:957 start_codon:yes stop_codon:yes gene_type:complete